MGQHINLMMLTTETLREIAHQVDWMSLIALSQANKHFHKVMTEVGMMMVYFGMPYFEEVSLCQDVVDNTDIRSNLGQQKVKIYK